MEILFGLVVASGGLASDLSAGKATTLGLALAIAYGLFQLVKFLVVKLVEVLQARRNGTKNNPGSVAAPTTGLPVLGGTNPAAGEVSAVVADPTKAPLTHGEHENLCGARQQVTNEKLTNINTRLSDTNDRINSIDTKLTENTKGIYEKLDKTTDSMNAAVTKLNAGVASIDAVLKDRTNRGG